jgi:uncharacterized protein YqgC (DUF456 family)
VSADVIATVLAGIFLAVAAFGTVYPVLPGSPVALVALIAWGWVLGSAASWAAAGIGALLVCVGWSAGALLTGRKLKKREIPRRSIVVALLAGIVGMFVIPVFGLFICFAVGLFVSEYVRQRDPSLALDNSVDALKAMGLGILVEFGMVALAGSVWTIGVIVHFAAA